MKKHLYILGAGLVALASCSSDPEPTPGPDAPEANTVTITFENTGLPTAGPTAYGANLYADYTGTNPARFISGEVKIDDSTSLRFGVNEGYDGEANFWNGGCALSQWHSDSGEGWQTYNNQCSAYVPKADKAGHDGSDTFLLVTGSTTGYDSSISFTNGAERVIQEVWVANAAYTYGVALHGNDFCKSLVDSFGWLSVKAWGFDSKGNATNGGEPVELYLCDYSTLPYIEMQSTWQMWSLSALGAVNSVRFTFQGSDSGEWGLNTPAYLCLDDLKVEE